MRAEVRRIVLELPGVQIPSLNTIIGRWSWREKEAWKNAAMSQLRLAADAQSELVEYCGRDGEARPTRLRIERFCWDPTHDEVNLIGGAKPLVDAIALTGLIRGDTRSDILEDFPPEVRDRANRRTVVTIEAITDDELAAAHQKIADARAGR